MLTSDPNPWWLEMTTLLPHESMAQLDGSSALVRVPLCVGGQLLCEQAALPTLSGPSPTSGPGLDNWAASAPHAVSFPSRPALACSWGWQGSCGLGTGTYSVSQSHPMSCPAPREGLAKDSTFQWMSSNIPL